jgi:hypothetical protein
MDTASCDTHAPRPLPSVGVVPAATLRGAVCSHDPDRYTSGLRTKVGGPPLLTEPFGGSLCPPLPGIPISVLMIGIYSI